MKRIKKIAPEEIEAESFRIIEAEIGTHGFSQEQWPVVRRMVHAAGDLALAGRVRFSPGAVAAGIAAIRAGKDVLTDTSMAVAGTSRGLLSRFGARVECRLNSPETAALAAEGHLTRSEAAIRLGLARHPGIVVIGNAPTALVEVVRMAAQGIRPDLVIAMPVGFVNAAESKELVEESDLAWITVQGRRGGTPAAVAAVNALIRLAVGER